MNHTDFVSRYQNNQVTVDIDKNKAGFMYEQQGLMPQNLRAKQAMIRTLAFGGIIMAIALFFFAPWWFGLGVLLFALYMFPQAQKNAARGVLQASLENPGVYEIAVQNQVLKVRELA